MVSRANSRPHNSVGSVLSSHRKVNLDPAGPWGQHPFEVHWRTLIGCVWASKWKFRGQAGRRFWRFTFQEDDMRTKPPHPPFSFPAIIHATNTNILAT